MEDVNQRYLGSPAQQPPQTATAVPSRTPVQASTSSSKHPPVQSSRSYTSTTSSDRQPSSYSSHTHGPTSSRRSSYGSSHGRTSSYKGKSSSKSGGGGWNLFKKKEAPVEYKASAPRKPITKHAITKASDWDKEVYCYALYGFKGELPCDLQFNKGQRIAIITRTATQNDWWEGTVNGKTGIFPANYVHL